MMRRRLMPMVISLILGAATTVGVAWGLDTSQRHITLVTYGIHPEYVEVSNSRIGWPSTIAVRDGAGTAAIVTTPTESLSEPSEAEIRPILPGFIINTLFYAAIWLVLFLGCTTAKRAIRRRRGRCPMCGYDLRGGVASSGQDGRSTGRDARSIGCPECGWNRPEPRV